MPRVLIYRSRLLPISETFIRQHYDSMSRYEPTFAALRELDELDIADTRRVVMSKGGKVPKMRIGLFKALGVGKAFVDAVAQTKPDLIHAHFAVDAADMLPVARRLGIPLVVTLHGYDVTFTDAAFKAMGPEGRIYLAKRARLFREASHFLPVSRFIAGQAAQAGAAPEKTTLHYLGIALDKFRPNYEARENVVLYVGRLVEKKGLNLLIEALERAGANEQGTTLRIIGDGPMRDTYLALAKAKLANVDYLGAQPHSRVVEELGKARVFCVPSVPSSNGDNEGLPISYMEASAAGVPVVSFAQGGILEAVKDGQTGLLAPTGDVDALAERLERLLLDPELGLRLGRAGRDHVEQVFDVRRQATHLEEIYDRILEG
ncbi:glycosyltransferase [Novosphingobium profundi]|uniref:glycosyltransferase n=1 Tax=Novosphingobium profundi TaxID=1774954 RepID=UPI001CFE9AAB|nr:glycosyltransferase [Novosphingobium profundi]